MADDGSEAFTWGRFDVDGRVAVQLFGRGLGLAVVVVRPGAFASVVLGVDNVR